MVSGREPNDSVPLQGDRGPGTEGLPRRERIARRSDFQTVYDKGRRERSRYTTVFSLPNDLGHPRLGITVTKKAGKATVRTRYKRWVREIYRKRRAEIGLDALSNDFVVNVSPGARTASFEKFARDLENAFRRVTRVRRAES